MSEPILHLPPESVLYTSKQPIDVMIGEVAALIGGDDDPVAQERALAALDRAADRLNMSGLFLFRLGAEVEDAPTASQSTISIPSDWGWPTDPSYASRADGTIINHIEWLAWDQFQQTKGGSSDAAVPAFAAIQNEFDQVAHVYPAIDTDEVDSVTLAYFTRILRPSEAADLYMTPETREALITGGQFFVLQFRYKDKPAIWQPYFKQFEITIQGARGAASRRQNAQHTWARPDESGHVGANTANVSPSRPVYLRL